MDRVRVNRFLEAASASLLRALDDADHGRAPARGAGALSLASAILLGAGGNLAPEARGCLRARRERGKEVINRRGSAPASGRVGASLRTAATCVARTKARVRSRRCRDLPSLR